MIGSNVPQIGGFKTGFLYGDIWNCDCIQIYITPSRRWDINTFSEEDIQIFKELWRKSKVKEIVAHIPFIVNLATPDEEHLEKSINRVISELKRAAALEINNLVLHPGSFKSSTREEGINRLIKSLNYIYDNVKDLKKNKLCLETMAGQGHMLCSSFNEIKKILDNVNQKFFGVCFDVAHVFISGYDIRGYKGYQTIMNQFDEIVGVDNIKVIHLNDSRTELGSKNDRHENIGEGKIGLQTFHSFVIDERFKKIPKIIEIPDRDEKSQENLNLLRNLQNKKKPINNNIQINRQHSLSEFF